MSTCRTRPKPRRWPLSYCFLLPWPSGYVSQTGSEHLTGPSHNVAGVSTLSTDLAGPLVPTLNQHFAFGLAAVGTSFVRLEPPTGVVDPAENGSYIGIPILLLLAVGLYRFRRDGLIRFSILMAAVSLVLSMGSDLHIWGHRTGIPLPFTVLTKFPFIKNEIASRYTLFMWLFIAIAVAVIVDRSRRAQAEAAPAP